MTAVLAAEGLLDVQPDPAGWNRRQLSLTGRGEQLVASLRQEFTAASAGSSHRSVGGAVDDEPSRVTADGARELPDEAICVTWMRGRGHEDVVRAFNGGIADLGRDRLDSVSGRSARRPVPQPEVVFLLRRRSDRVVVLEPRGNLGGNDEALLDACGAGEALDLMWDVNPHARVTCVRDRSIVFASGPAVMSTGEEDFDGACPRSGSLCVDGEAPGGRAAVSTQCPQVTPPGQ